MSQPQCRSCKAIIRWITMTSGRPMPVDPELLSEWVHDKRSGGAMAPVVLVTEDGTLVRGFRASMLDPGTHQIEGYLPHWASCPSAAEHK